MESHIGDLVLTSEMTTSQWGDKHLFFRHQMKDEDVALFPEWEQYLDKFGAPAAGCPVANMFREMKKGRVAHNY